MGGRIRRIGQGWFSQGDGAISGKTLQKGLVFQVLDHLNPHIDTQRGCVCQLRRMGLSAGAVAGIVIPLVAILIAAIGLLIARMMCGATLHVYKKVEPHALDDEELAFKSVLEQSIDMELEPFQLEDDEDTGLGVGTTDMDSMEAFDREELEQLQLLEEYQRNLIQGIGGGSADSSASASAIASASASASGAGEQESNPTAQSPSAPTIVEA